MAALTESQMVRRNNKRRRAAVEQAVQFFQSNVPNIKANQKRYALKQIQASGRPLLTAKALVRKFRDAQPPAEHQACLDQSAAQEARVSLIRRQHPVLQGVAAYEDDLGSLERKLVTGKIGQAKFDKRCEAIAERELPEWMQDYAPPAYPLPQSPIQRIPSNVLHKELGCEGVGVGKSSFEVTGSIPEFMVRRKI